MGRGLEKITTTYQEILENFATSRVKIVNLLYHPVYVDEIKVFKKPKLI